MQQNVSEKNENLDNHLVTVFDEVANEGLRAKNRGAIMANIFERYVDQRTGRLPIRDFGLMSREMDSYTSRIPKKERALAKKEMHLHLANRGYKAIES